VTDANVVLGRIPSSLKLGGSVELDLPAAHSALASIGDRIGLGVESIAEGIVDVVDAHMERALRAVSVEEGADPREAVLVAFGGSGGLHATGLAKRLGIRKVLIPPLSGVFSALGLLLARPSSDSAKTVMLDEGSAGLAASRDEILAAVRQTFLADHGRLPEEVEAWADVRYFGQSHELKVGMDDDWPRLRGAFEDLHLARFGFIRPGEPIELVNVRAEATAPPPITWDDIPRLTPRRGVEGHTSAVIARGALAPGDQVEGPTVVIEADSAVWLESDDVLSVHDDGTLEIEW
jgi:N-methylhydantoinase A